MTKTDKNIEQAMSNNNDPTMDEMIVMSQIKAMKPVLQRCRYNKCGFTFMSTAGENMNTCPNCHGSTVRLNVESELNRNRNKEKKEGSNPNRLRLYY